MARSPAPRRTPSPARGRLCGRRSGRPFALGACGPLFRPLDPRQRPPPPRLPRALRCASVRLPMLSKGPTSEWPSEQSRQAQACKRSSMTWRVGASVSSKLRRILSFSLANWPRPGVTTRSERMSNPWACPGCQEDPKLHLALQSVGVCARCGPARPVPLMCPPRYARAVPSLPGLGPNLVDVAPVPTKSGESCPKFGRIRNEFDTRFGPLHFGRCWLSPRIWPTLPRFGKHWSTSGLNATEPGHFRRRLVNIGPTLVCLCGEGSFGTPHYAYA